MSENIGRNKRGGGFEQPYFDGGEPTFVRQEIEDAYPHAVQIDEVIREIIDSLEKDITERGLEFSFDFPEHIVAFPGNRDTVHTILDEVICNSVKYNKLHGKIQIQITQQDDICRVVVSDTGVGFGEEIKDDVFKRFYRAPSSVQLHSRGAGLGLHMAQELIGAHGGSISLISEEGKGTKATLIFNMYGSATS